MAVLPRAAVDVASEGGGVVPEVPQRCNELVRLRETVQPFTDNYRFCPGKCAAVCRAMGAGKGVTVKRQIADRRIKPSQTIDLEIAAGQA